MYVCPTSTSLAALNAANGALIWQRKVTYAAINGVAMGNGLLYLSEQGGISAHRMSNGTEVWHAALTNDVSGNSVLRPVVAGTTVYTIACNRTSGHGTPTLYALDGQHGYVIWKHPLSQPLASSPHPLVVADNVLIYGTLSYTSKTAQANETGASLTALRASDGRALWQTWIGGFADPSLTVDGQTVYAVTIDPGDSTTRLYAWQLDNGRQRWSTSLW